jgi:hypothetical protein
MRGHPSLGQDAGSRPAHEEDRHTPFLMYQHFLFLKIAGAAVAVSIFLYILDTPLGEPYGGTWVGYLLGTVGALLIIWLMWFGYRKRSYAAGHIKLEAWLSGHVYLGLALLIIATLHTGFHFGWNIHTAAYALMCIVIASGAFGIYCYVHYPRLMTENRAGTTMPQIVGRIAALDDELRASAMTMKDAPARLITRATETTSLGGSVWRQISGKYPQCATDAAITGLKQIEEAEEIAARPTAEEQATYRQVRVLLDEKAQLLGRARRDISFKAMMDLWLYFHVPVSFGLLAALSAHVISVFFYW